MEDIIKMKDIKDIEVNNLYFHYTNIKNIGSISRNGLEPRIGKNSKGIELNEKIFFAIGDVGVLVLMDAWIRWLLLRPENTIIYELGSFFMRKSYFPKIIIDKIFNAWIKDEAKFYKSIKKLEKILDDSVFLILDLEEKIDFDFNDIDEVKAQKYSRNQLKYIYCYDKSDVNNKKMEYWNMHTYSGKCVNKEKISLLHNDKEISANKILVHFAKNNEEYIFENCKFLYKYLNYLEQKNN